MLRFALAADESVIAVLSELLRRGRRDGEFPELRPQGGRRDRQPGAGQRAAAVGTRRTVEPAADAAELAALFDLATRG